MWLWGAVKNFLWDLKIQLKHGEMGEKLDLCCRFIMSTFLQCCSLLTLRSFVLNYMLIANEATQSRPLPYTGWLTVRCAKVGFRFPHAAFRFVVWTREFWLPAESLIGRSGCSFHDTWSQLPGLRTTTRTKSKSSNTVIKYVFNDTWVPSCVCSGNNRYAKAKHLRFQCLDLSSLQPRMWMKWVLIYAF